MILALKVFYFFDISCFHPALFRLPVVRDTGFTADILNSSPSFDGLQNSDDLVFQREEDGLYRQTEGFTCAFLFYL